MVTFICDACGESLKKDKVDNHYRNKCPNCAVLSCIDCGKDFPGDSYAAHTSCISEAQKYQGALYKPKDKGNKGDRKQNAWLSSVAEAADSITDPKMRAAYDKIKGYANIPRKERKFINFAKNSLNIYDDKFLGTLWTHFSAKPAKPVTPAADPAPADSAAAAATAADAAVATVATPSLIAQLAGKATTGKKSKKEKKEKKSKKDKKDGKRKADADRADADAGAKKAKKAKKSKKA